MSATAGKPAFIYEERGGKVRVRPLLYVVIYSAMALEAFA
jgi:hypothetical protein